MANPNVIIHGVGLVPLNATEQDFMEIEVQSNNAAAIYPGYPVVAQSDGSVLRTAAAGGAGSTAVCIEILSLKDAVTGQVRTTGIRRVPANTVWTADKDRTRILVCLLNQHIRWKMMTDAAVASIAAARATRWANINHVYGTESPANGLGNCKAAIAGVNTTDTLQWRIINPLLDVPGNDPTQAGYALVVVPNVPPVGLPPLFGGSATGV